MQEPGRSQSAYDGWFSPSRPQSSAPRQSASLPPLPPASIALDATNENLSSTPSPAPLSPQLPSFPSSSSHLKALRQQHKEMVQRDREQIKSRISKAYSSWYKPESAETDVISKLDSTDARYYGPYHPMPARSSRLAMSLAGLPSKIPVPSGLNARDLAFMSQFAQAVHAPDGSSPSSFSSSSASSSPSSASLPTILASRTSNLTECAEILTQFNTFLRYLDTYSTPHAPFPPLPSPQPPSAPSSPPLSSPEASRLSTTPVPFPPSSSKSLPLHIYSDSSTEVRQFLGYRDQMDQHTQHNEERTVSDHYSSSSSSTSSHHSTRRLQKYVVSPFGDPHLSSLTHDSANLLPVDACARPSSSSSSTTIPFISSAPLPSEVAAMRASHPQPVYLSSAISRSRCLNQNIAYIQECEIKRLLAQESFDSVPGTNSSDILSLPLPQPTVGEFDNANHNDTTDESILLSSAEGDKYSSNQGLLHYRHVLQTTHLGGIMDSTHQNRITDTSSSSSVAHEDQVKGSEETNVMLWHSALPSALIGTMGYDMHSSLHRVAVMDAKDQQKHASVVNQEANNSGDAGGLSHVVSRKKIERAQRRNEQMQEWVRTQRETVSNTLHNDVRQAVEETINRTDVNVLEEDSTYNEETAGYCGNITSPSRSGSIDHGERRDSFASHHPHLSSTSLPSALDLDDNLLPTLPTVRLPSVLSSSSSSSSPSPSSLPSHSLSNDLHKEVGTSFPPHSAHPQSLIYDYVGVRRGWRWISQSNLKSIVIKMMASTSPFATALREVWEFVVRRQLSFLPTDTLIAMVASLTTYLLSAAYFTRAAIEIQHQQQQAHEQAMKKAAQSAILQSLATASSSTSTRVLIPPPLPTAFMWIQAIRSRPTLAPLLRLSVIAFPGLIDQMAINDHTAYPFVDKATSQTHHGGASPNTTTNKSGGSSLPSLSLPPLHPLLLVPTVIDFLSTSKVTPPTSSHNTSSSPSTPIAPSSSSHPGISLLPLIETLTEGFAGRLSLLHHTHVLLTERLALLACAASAGYDIKRTSTSKKDSSPTHSSLYFSSSSEHQSNPLSLRRPQTSRPSPSPSAFSLTSSFNSTTQISPSSSSSQSSLRRPATAAATVLGRRPKRTSTTSTTPSLSLTQQIPTSSSSLGFNRTFDTYDRRSPFNNTINVSSFYRNPNNYNHNNYNYSNQYQQQQQRGWSATDTRRINNTHIHSSTSRPGTSLSTSSSSFSDTASSAFLASFGFTGTLDSPAHSLSHGIQSGREERGRMENDSDSDGDYYYIPHDQPLPSNNDYYHDEYTTRTANSQGVGRRRNRPEGLTLGAVLKLLDEAEALHTLRAAASANITAPPVMTSNAPLDAQGSRGTDQSRSQSTGNGTSPSGFNRDVSHPAGHQPSHNMSNRSTTFHPINRTKYKARHHLGADESERQGEDIGTDAGDSLDDQDEDESHVAQALRRKIQPKHPEMITEWDIRGTPLTHWHAPPLGMLWAPHPSTLIPPPPTKGLGLLVSTNTIPRSRSHNIDGNHRLSHYQTASPKTAPVTSYSHLKKRVSNASSPSSVTPSGDHNASPLSPSSSSSSSASSVSSFASSSSCSSSLPAPSSTSTSLPSPASSTQKSPAEQLMDTLFGERHGYFVHARAALRKAAISIIKRSKRLTRLFASSTFVSTPSSSLLSPEGRLSQPLHSPSPAVSPIFECVFLPLSLVLHSLHVAERAIAAEDALFSSRLLIHLCSDGSTLKFSTPSVSLLSSSPSSSQSSSAMNNHLDPLYDHLASPLSSLDEIRKFITDGPPTMTEPASSSTSLSISSASSFTSSSSSSSTMTPSSHDNPTIPAETIVVSTSTDTSTDDRDWMMKLNTLPEDAMVSSVTNRRGSSAATAAALAALSAVGLGDNSATNHPSSSSLAHHLAMTQTQRQLLGEEGQRHPPTRANLLFELSNEMSDVQVRKIQMNLFAHPIVSNVAHLVCSTNLTKSSKIARPPMMEARSSHSGSQGVDILHQEGVYDMLNGLRPIEVVAQRDAEKEKKRLIQQRLEEQRKAREKEEKKKRAEEEREKAREARAKRRRIEEEGEDDGTLHDDELQEPTGGEERDSDLENDGYPNGQGYLDENLEAGENGDALRSTQHRRITRSPVLGSVQEGEREEDEEEEDRNK